MAKKTLGYVELEWVCPTCNSRNPGSSRVCRACGAGQPPDVKFEAPAQADLITDAEVVAQEATRAPDIACPYCDTRNPSDATVCKQCGGDLVAGTVRSAGHTVEAFSLAPAPPVNCTACGAENPAGQLNCASCGAPLPRAKPKPKAKPEPQQGGRGCLYIAAAFALVVVLGIVAMFAFGGGGERTTLEANVVEGRWTRTVAVEGLAPARYTAWADQIPVEATVGACTEQVRRTVDELPEPAPPHREVCGTPYAIDRGTGMAEVVADCQYEILELRCEYTVNEWQVVRREEANGIGLTALWPDPALGGRERLGARDEAYTCVFAANDNTYSYRLASAALYQRCVPGSRWELEVTESGRVVRAQPVD